MQALAGIALARDQNLAAIDAALTATLRVPLGAGALPAPGGQRHRLLEQLAVEQLAHAGAANLARGISAAMDSLDETLTTLRERWRRAASPTRGARAVRSPAIEAALGGGMGTLLGTMEEGAQKARSGMAEDWVPPRSRRCPSITTKNDEISAQAESGSPRR